MTPANQRSVSFNSATSVIATRPGLTERLFVIVTWFVMINGTPETWFVEQTISQGIEEGAPLTTAALLMLGGLAGLRIFGQIDLTISALTLSLPLLGFLLMFPASVFWTNDLALTGRTAVLTFCVLLFALYLILRFELAEILVLLAWSTCLGFIVNLAFVLALPQFGLSPGGEWEGVFIQKNATGFAVTLGLPILLAAAGVDRRRRTLYYAFSALAVVMLIRSESKTMLIATALPVTCMFVYHWFRAKKTLRGAVITSLVTASIVAGLFVTANLAFVADILDKDVTLTGRTDLWADLVPVALERPLLGHGANAAFGGFFSPVHDVWIQNRWSPQHAHNALFQIILDIGIVGASLFLVAFLRAIPNSIHYLRQVRGRPALWPLTFLTTTLLVSISESGVTVAPSGFVLLILACWVPAHAIRTGAVDPTQPFESEESRPSDGESSAVPDSMQALATR